MDRELLTKAMTMLEKEGREFSGAATQLKSIIVKTNRLSPAGRKKISQAATKKWRKVRTHNPAKKKVLHMTVRKAA